MGEKVGVHEMVGVGENLGGKASRGEIGKSPARLWMSEHQGCMVG